MLSQRVGIAPDEPPRRYDPPHILWYFGALTGAVTANATVLSIDDTARGTWQLLVGLLFMGAFGVTAVLLLQSGWRVPGGVLVVTTIAMIPAVGQALQRLLGTWPSDPDDVVGLFEGDFQGAFFALGLVTIAAGVIAFALVRFPFIFVTVTAAVIVTAQLLVPAVVDDPGANDHASFFVVTGAVLLLVGFVLDSVARGDDAFWWHVSGLLALAVGLGWYATARDDSWAWVAILIIATVLVLASAPFNRATWTTYGVLGVFGVMLHYAETWLGSWKEPAFMVAVSIGLILLGIALQLNARIWAARLNRSGAAPPPPTTAIPPERAEAAPAAPVPEPEPPGEQWPAEPPEERPRDSP